MQHIVHLMGGGTHLHLGVYQACGAHHLLHHLTRMGHLISGRGGRDKHQLAHALFELLQLQWPIVQGRRQAETVLDKRGFARFVAVVHATELAHQHMAFVQKHDRVFGQVIRQGTGRITRCRAGEVPGVVFNALAVPHLAQHLQVKPGALLDTLGLHQLALSHELLAAFVQFDLDGLNGGQHAVARRHVVAARVDREARNFLLDAARQRVQQLQ